jgi:hypothetical protein
MTQHSNENRGAIWKNDDKQSDNHPDFKGSLNVDGVEYWVSAWKRKEGASAKAPALSFSIKPKDDKPRRQEPQRASQHKPGKPDTFSSGRRSIMPDDDMDGDRIPF